MSYGINDAKALIARVSDIIEAHKDELNELDGRSGDGDLGMSVALGLAATKASAEAFEGDDMGKDACHGRHGLQPRGSLHDGNPRLQRHHGRGQGVQGQDRGRGGRRRRHPQDLR